MQRDERQEVLYWGVKAEPQKTVFKIKNKYKQQAKNQKIVFSPLSLRWIPKLNFGWVCYAYTAWLVHQGGGKHQSDTRVDNNEQRHPFSELPAASREGMWEQHVKTQSFKSLFFPSFFFLLSRQLLYKTKQKFVINT